MTEENKNKVTGITYFEEKFWTAYCQENDITFVLVSDIIRAYNSKLDEKYVVAEKLLDYYYGSPNSELTKIIIKNYVISNNKEEKEAEK